jgi:hypothetical protein
MFEWLLIFWELRLWNLKNGLLWSVPIFNSHPTTGTYIVDKEYWENRTWPRIRM